MSDNINSTTIQLITAKALTFHDGESPFASVFCFHNRYMGPKRDAKAIPISVVFRGRTLAFARKVLTQDKGQRFVVTGQLDADPREKGGHFFQIIADQFVPLESSPQSPDDPSE